jgi:serine/threonine-protein kinase
MSVSYTVKNGSFVPGKPRLWTATALTPTALRSMGVAYGSSIYDLAPDGKRVAAFMDENAANGQAPITHLNFLVNFFDEVRRRVPADK